MSNTYKDYECVKCGHEVMAPERPAPIRWTDGHVCSFREVPSREEDSKNGKEVVYEKQN